MAIKLVPLNVSIPKNYPCQRQICPLPHWSLNFANRCKWNKREIVHICTTSVGTRRRRVRSQLTYIFRFGPLVFFGTLFYRATCFFVRHESVQSSSNPLSFFSSRKKETEQHGTKNQTQYLYKHDQTTFDLGGHHSHSSIPSYVDSGHKPPSSLTVI